MPIRCLQFTALLGLYTTFNIDRDIYWHPQELCDRVGILVAGRLRCIGDPGALASRFGAFYVLHLNTPPGADQDAAAAALVRRLSPGARFVYATNGSHSWEVPKADASLRQLFEVLRDAKRSGDGSLKLLEYAVSDATLEQAFVAVAAPKRDSASG